jgi:heptosyltransferase II
MTKSKSVLAISVAGIGNTILFSPFLEELHKRKGEYSADIVVWNKGMADIVSDMAIAESVYVVPKGWIRRLKFILVLRRKHYDYSITAFPSNNWKYNLFAYLVGAKRRVTHGYSCCKIRSLSSLQNNRIRAVEGIHDVIQNLNLLKAFEIDIPENIVSPHLRPGGESLDFADSYLKANNLEKQLLIGIHPGAGGDWDLTRQGNAKRWPYDKFAELCREIVKTFGARIILFGGPEESDLKSEVIWKSGIPDSIFTVDGSLSQSLALISKCVIFVSNDSGLMHTAVALEVPTIGIMGPWNKYRTVPFGDGWTRVMRGSDKPYKFSYPFASTSSRITTDPDFDYFEGVTVAGILDVLKERLNTK